MPPQLPLIVAVVLASVKDRADLVAENLALRHQLSCLKHRRKRPTLRPIDRGLWVLLSRFWGRWNELLVMVKPETVVAWHRKGFKLFWRWKSRRHPPGRPRITKDVQRLIVNMAATNVGWGAPRIHGELLKLGTRISQSTVQRYMPRRKPSPESRQRWRTFLRNHVHESLAIDFAVVPTITFEIIYVFFVLSVDRRRILHFNVTKHPTADWTVQQVVEACPFDTAGRFLYRDNDKIYGTRFTNRVDGLGLTQVKTAFRSPWQNPFAERWIGGLRRDCLDHVIAVNESQLRRVIKSYIAYFHCCGCYGGVLRSRAGGMPVSWRVFPRCCADRLRSFSPPPGFRTPGSWASCSSSIGRSRPSHVPRGCSSPSSPSSEVSFRSVP